MSKKKITKCPGCGRPVAECDGQERGCVQMTLDRKIAWFLRAKRPEPIGRDIAELYDIVQSLVRLKFGTSEVAGSPVQIKLIDLTRFAYLPFLPVPLNDNITTREQRRDAFVLHSLNLQAASDGVNTMLKLESSLQGKEKKAEPETTG